jgi:hypothetical protein
MKKISFAVLTALLATSASLVWAKQGAKIKSDKGEVEDQTVTGEIVDLACYLSHGVKGAKHATCAKKCLASGSPMGLLTKQGSLFLLVNDHEHEAAYDSAKKLAAELVKVTGDISHKGGLKALIVDKVQKVGS